MTKIFNPIREWREENAMTQKNLAEKLGAHVATVKSWEQDLRKMPSMQLRKKLAALIGISTTELRQAYLEQRNFKLEKDDGRTDA